MQTRIGLAAWALLGAGLAHAQFGRGAAEWSTTAGDAQRSSWIRTDAKITTEAVQKPGFQMLWKVKFNNEPNQLNSLTSASLLGSYIGYRGFRSYAFIGGSADSIFAVDTDLGKKEWEKQFALGVPPKAGTWACPGGQTSSVTRATGLPYPGAAAGGRGGRAGAAKSGVGDTGEGAVTVAEIRANAARAAAATPGGRGPDALGGRGADAAAAAARGGRAPARPVSLVHALSSDGMLHSMYVSNGDEPEPPVPFLPAGANAQGLIVVDSVAYAATSHACGGASDGVWALDLMTKQVKSWKSGSGAVAGSAGAAMSPDGLVYAATEGGELAVLDAKTLEMKDAYKAGPGFTTSPVIFPFKDKTMVAALAKDGSVHVLDAANVKEAAAKSAANAAVANPDAGSLSTWQDASGTRWLMAPGKTAVVAWKVADHNGKPALEAGWTSREMVAPLTPMILNGVVFAVSSGEFRSTDASLTAAQRAQRSVPAVLYALDGMSGKELWSSGKSMTSFVHGGGLAAGASQLYLGTYDGNFYSFGIWIEH